MSNRYDFEYREHRFSFEVTPSELVLSLDGLPRKRRSRDAGDCLYVWTNVELHWEEHHYIEGRWWPQTGRLVVTANRAVIHEAVIQ
ncbi:MAG: hypothetical protein HC809_00920 [Gammaproteobacteria bacterium]|nr:hypothetical protein [Gammaproteobacteria bacterium]